MPGRSRRGRGGSAPLPALLVALAVLPVSGARLAAQEPSPDVEPPPVRGSFEVLATVGAMAERTPVLLGARAGLRFPSGLLLLGSGHALARPLELAGASAPFHLTLGYGGVGVGAVLQREGVEPIFSLLVAAAHGEVRSRFTGAELASENLFVLEPTAGGTLALHPVLAVGASLGYRWTSPVEKLPGISSGGLRGWNLSLSARLQQRP